MVWDLQEKVHILEISCKTGQGTNTWAAWLVNQYGAVTKNLIGHSVTGKQETSK